MRGPGPSCSWLSAHSPSNVNRPFEITAPRLNAVTAIRSAGRAAGPADPRALLGSAGLRRSGCTAGLLLRRALLAPLRPGTRRSGPRAQKRRR